MNPCLWLLLLQEFGTLQTSLLKHNRRLKQRDSLSLNAALGAGRSESPVWVRVEAQVGDLGAKSPRSWSFLHIIFCIFCPMQVFSQVKGGHEPSGLTLVPSRLTLPSLSAPSLPFPEKRRRPPENLEILHCVSKNTPDIFSCNLNEHFLISIILGTNIT